MSDSLRTVGIVAVVVMIVVGVIGVVGLSGDGEPAPERAMVVVPDAMLDCAAAISSAIEPGDDGLRLVAVGSTTDVSDVEAPVVGAIVEEGEAVPAALGDAVVVGRADGHIASADPAYVETPELVAFVEGYQRSCPG